MKLNYSFLILLAATFGYSQTTDLTVTGDNYLYSNNTVIYVEHGINLDTNRADTDGDDISDGSNIYLRNGAQLLQGDDNSSNSGDGAVSIIAGGDTNKWSYTYWSSPVHTNATNQSFTLGDFQKPLNSGSASMNGSVGAGDGTESLAIQFQNEATTNSWGNENGPGVDEAIPLAFAYHLDNNSWAKLNSSTEIDAGKGFTLKGKGNSNNGTNHHFYDFRGIPNNGTIEVPFNRTTGQLETFIGNPYPSLLDISQFHIENRATANTGPNIGTANIGLVSEYKFWQNSLGNKSHYRVSAEGGFARLVLNDDGTIATTSRASIRKYASDTELDGTPTGLVGPGSKDIGQYIPVGQGFYAVFNDTDFTSGGAPNVLTFNNTQRFNGTRVNNQGTGSGGTGDFFRASTSKNSRKNNSTKIRSDRQIYFNTLPETHKRFRLVTDMGEVDKELVMTFFDDATEGFDNGFEAKDEKKNNDISFLDSNNNTLKMNALKFNENLKIPLRIHSSANKEITIKLSEEIHIEDNEIYLHDKYIEEYYNLRENNAVLTLENAELNDRYEITFKAPEFLSNVLIESSDFKVVHRNNTNELIIFNPSAYNIMDVSIYDISGKSVLRKVVSSSSREYKLNTSNLTSGVYLTTIHTANNGDLTKKFIIK